MCLNQPSEIEATNLDIEKETTSSERATVKLGIICTRTAQKYHVTRITGHLQILKLCPKVKNSIANYY